MHSTPTTSDSTILGMIAVRDAMHEGVLSCPTDAPLSTVAELMAAKNVHCVVVTDRDDTSV